MFPTPTRSRSSPSPKAPPAPNEANYTPPRSSVSASPPLSLSSSASTPSKKDASHVSTVQVINVFENKKRFQNARNFTRPILSSTPRSNQGSPTLAAKSGFQDSHESFSEGSLRGIRLSGSDHGALRSTADESSPVASGLAETKARSRVALKQNYAAEESDDAGKDERQRCGDYGDEESGIEGHAPRRVARGINLQQVIRLPQTKADSNELEQIDIQDEDIRDIVNAVLGEWRRAHSNEGLVFKDSIENLKSQIRALMDFDDSQYPESYSEIHEVDEMNPPSPTPSHGLHWQDWKTRIDNFRRSSFHITRDTNEKDVLFDTSPKSLESQIKEDKLSPKANDGIISESTHPSITRTNTNSGFFNWKKQTETSAAIQSAMEDLQAQKIKYQSENQELKETVENLEIMVKQKTERCQILEQANATLVGELEELTKSLFEEANTMVSQANRTAHEREYESNLLKIKVNQQEQTIKLLEHELEYEKSRIYHKSLSYITDKFRDVKLSLHVTDFHFST